MSFGRKVFILVFASVSFITAATLYYLECQDYYVLRDLMRAKGLSIAVTAAAQVDGDLHSAVVAGGKEGTPQYDAMVNQLRRVRDLNRREDSFIGFVYTLISDENNVIRFAVDAEEAGADHSNLGEVYRKKGEPIQIGKVYADREINHDQWGSWISAYAPIHDSKGDVVGSLAVDIPSFRLEKLWQESLKEMFYCMGMGILAAFISSIVIARMVRRPLHQLQYMVRQIGSGNFSVHTRFKSNDEFSEVGGLLEEMAKSLAERDRVKGAFARFVSQQVMDTVLAEGAAPIVQGRRRRITVMFCDIRGFTSLSEKLSPEEVVSLLNEYFEVMVEIVFKYHGTLDKFIGDGIMIIFGAPQDDPYQEEHAVRAALEMREATQALSDRWSQEKGISLTIGIGIHSGNAVVGNIGSSRRMEYTAIGDTVNLASRLESATKKHSVDILMSEFTYHSVRGLFTVAPIGAVSVPGREETVASYTVLGAQRGDDVEASC